jgi:hypothetical protein
MDSQLLICIPGPWKDRSEFLRQVITLEPKGRYMWAGAILADIAGKDHVPLEFTFPDPAIPKAFEIAGQGKIPQATLDRIREHSSVVYLHFPLDIRAQRERVIKFTELLQRLSGAAVKVESAGVAHTWERWFGLLNGSLFELYSSVVTLVGDVDYYYSCGMHHFGLPECAVPTSVPVGEAADLMNRFNLWQIAEAPTLKSGHTFSLSADAPRYRLTLDTDRNHEPGEPFFNDRGVWSLTMV